MTQHRPIPNPDGYEYCRVCGAVRRYRGTDREYRWYRDGKPQPYCSHFTAFPRNDSSTS